VGALPGNGLGNIPGFGGIALPSLAAPGVSAPAAPAIGAGATPGLGGAANVAPAGIAGLTALDPDAAVGVEGTWTLASFSDTRAGAAELEASIGWGDGESSDGTIVPQGGGVYEVVGAHRYWEVGELPVDVTVAEADDPGSSQIAANTMYVTNPPAANDYVPTSGADFTGAGPGYQVSLSPSGAQVVWQPGVPGTAASVLTMNLVGANPAATPSLAAGNGTVDYAGVWTGVSALYAGGTAQPLDYTFVVAPGVSPAVVQTEFGNATGLSLDGAGNLSIALPAGRTVVQARPVIYQESAGSTQLVEGGYQIAGNVVSYKLGAAYNTSLPLYIDPSITGTVTDDSTSGGLANVVVDLSGDTTSEVTTDSSGAYLFDGLDAEGDYTVAFAAPPHYWFDESASGAYTIGAGNVAGSPEIDASAYPLGPTIVSPGNQMNVEGDAVDFNVTASQPEYDALTFSMTGQPASLDIDPAIGVIGTGIGYNTAGDYTVVITASDGASGLSASTTIDWTVSAAPGPTLVSPGDQTSTEGDTGISVTMQAGQALGDPLSFSGSGLTPGIT
ncbi:MAG TPA: carboxypeptidase regulatory-like domain-containing protein, partial [Acidimicrobiales bacterium]